MDEVICNFLGYLCLLCRYKLNLNIYPEQINKWELKSFIGEDGMELYKQPGFFLNLLPFDYAVETLYNLNKRHEIFICSNPPNAIGAAEKIQWIEENLPFLSSDQIILTCRKEIINADLIFDDCPKYLNSFPGIKVAMARPYNIGMGDYRVSYWEQFAEIIEEIEDSVI
jgi:5'(3')-deoxyribonucleotidase